MSKKKIIHGYLTQARDAAILGDGVTPRVTSPTIEMTEISRLSSTSINSIKDCEPENFELIHRTIPISLITQIINHSMDSDDLEILWLSYYWECAKLTQKETIHKDDYYSPADSHRTKQALYLYHIGFYKRLIYTEPVSLLDKDGEKLDYSKDRLFKERQVVSYLNHRELEAAFGSRERIIKDDWIAYDGKLGGIDQHKTVSNKSKYLNARVEGPLVIIAMWLVLGKEGQRTQISLMRGAQVFECYKKIRTLIKSKCKLRNREPLDASAVFGIVKDSQLCLITTYECSVCRVPFYDVSEIPECPRGCNNPKILRPI